MGSDLWEFLKEFSTVPNKLIKLRRCSNYRKSNYRESTVYFFSLFTFYVVFVKAKEGGKVFYCVIFYYKTQSKEWLLFRKNYNLFKRGLITYNIRLAVCTFTWPLRVWCAIIHVASHLLKPVNYVWGRLVCRIRAGVGCMSVGRTLKYLKRGWNRKEGKWNKDFKMVGGGTARSRSGHLIKGGLKPPFELCYHVPSIVDLSI